MRSLHSLPSTLLVLISTAASALSPAQDEASSSVIINIINPVACSRPTRNGDKIQVHYSGRLLSTGAQFDSSYDRGKPFDFTLGAHEVIPGWDEGLLDMCPGEARELTIPPELAYGDRGTGPIPPGSTLVFDTELVDIVGVDQSPSSAVAPSPTVTGVEEVEDTFTIATAPPTPPSEDATRPPPPPPPPPPSQSPPPKQVGSEEGPHAEAEEHKKKECQLLGAFALIVQGALGGMALLTLVWKRYRETPRRPWKIWFFDVSKQVFGSMLTHVLNIVMSMLGSIALANQAEKFGTEAHDTNGRRPNPCSYYLLNLAIDTTLGIPILYILLKIIHALCLYTPLANPPQSLKSGNYGDPPHVTWYLKQLIMYFAGLTGMKLCVFILFTLLPWLPWVGDWALRWTKGNEKLEIAFALLIFPLIMNALQYYIIDNLIMDKKREVGYQAVHEEDDESRLASDENTLEVEEEEDGQFKLDDDEPLKEANPTPIPEYNHVRSAGSSRKSDKKQT